MHSDRAHTSTEDNRQTFSQKMAENLFHAYDHLALPLQIKFSGTTPLGTNLDRRVIQPLVIGPSRCQQLRKPVLVIVITDGEPTGEPRDCVRQVILNSKRTLEQSPLGPGAVAFQFAQVQRPL